MDKTKIMQELGFDSSQELPITDRIKYTTVKGIVDGESVATAKDLAQTSLYLIYNALFCEPGEEGIPTFGPYDIPVDVLISSIKSRKPLDIEQYKEKDLPDDVVF